VERRRRGGQEEETRARAFVVPVRLRHVAVVHEQRKRCISDVAMMLMKKIIIIIGRRRRREYRFRSSREKKEEREEKEKARFWSPGRKRKRRRKARRHLRTTRRLRDDTVNESIHRIKRIIYNGETKTTDQPFFCFFFVSLSFFFVLTRQMISRFFFSCFSRLFFSSIKDDAFKLVLWL
jgi:hypothetical protein